jgi:protein-disulfide isomerase
MSKTVERILNVALTLAALSIAGTLMHREFAPSAATITGPQQGVTFESDWKTLWVAGTVVGDPAAPVKIIEVIDLECPFCSRFNATLANVLAASAGEIAVSYVHLPIPGHRFAMPGARAAECAGTEGKFGSFVDLVYRQQDSIGEKAWAAFARESGVIDSAGFAACMSTKRFDKKINAARDAARAADIAATPTLLINGWRFNQPPSEAELGEAITSVKSGKRPSIAGQSRPTRSD